MTAADSVGSIRGNIEAVGQPTAVTAVNRTNNKKYPGQLDTATGEFNVDQLPLGSKYDLVIDYGTARLEGISLSVPTSDYEEEQPLTDDDVKTIREKVLSMNKFEDQVEILAMEGNIQHAAILLNKLRTKPFVNSQPGEAVWRVELWHFERPEETWVKVQDELFLTLYRERLQKSAYDQKSLTFTPALGGLSPTAESPMIDVGRIVLPPAARGVRWQARREKNDE
ncbi:MAG TPA: hypothetical protein VFI31_22025 [Pirellulales bacterium]|nr:hypothetical protein [Pirellulales bacterium]